MKGLRGLRAGMSLVELIVVLTILLALAGTALLATEGIVDQGRRDATVRSLDVLREAVVGREGLIDANDKPWVRGFVADMGRLPLLSGAAPELGLLELWAPPDDSNALFAIDAPDGDEFGVKVAAGWRGPYVQPSLGQVGLLDGWGNPFVFWNAASEPAAEGEPIAQILSLGADQQVGGAGYDADLSIVLENSLGIIAHKGSVPVRVTGLEPGVQVVLRIYGPELDDADLSGGPAGTIAQLGPLAEVGGQVSAVFEYDPMDPIDKKGITIGPRILRAYVVADDTAAPGKDDEIVSLVSTPVVPIMVVAGGLHEVAIDLDVEEAP